jgi:hypothetical protein
VIKTDTSNKNRRSPRSFLFELYLWHGRALAATKPRSGNHSAYRSPFVEETFPADTGAVVVTVRLPLAPGANELGLIEHFGARAGDGCTAHAKETGSTNPFIGERLNVDVADCPADKVAGVSADAVTEKSGGVSELNVGVTVVSPFMVTVHVPEPEQPAPLQPPKLDPEAAEAVSVTAVPGKKNAAHELAGQSMPGGALVTLPVPLPAKAMLS